MRTATFKLRDTTVQYDGQELKHISGPRNMFVVAQGDCELIQERADPDVEFTYQPDRVNGTADILIKRYGGRMVRPAPALEFDPEAIY